MILQKCQILFSCAHTLIELIIQNYFCPILVISNTCFRVPRQQTKWIWQNYIKLGPYNKVNQIQILDNITYNKEFFSEMVSLYQPVEKHFIVRNFFTGVIVRTRQQLKYSKIILTLFLFVWQSLTIIFVIIFLFAFIHFIIFFTF